MGVKHIIFAYLLCIVAYTAASKANLDENIIIVGAGRNAKNKT
jgi:hypothetical protein